MSNFRPNFFRGNAAERLNLTYLNNNNTTQYSAFHGSALQEKELNVMLKARVQRGMRNDQESMRNRYDIE